MKQWPAMMDGGVAGLWTPVSRVSTRVMECSPAHRWHYYPHAAFWPESQFPSNKHLPKGERKASKDECACNHAGSIREET